MKREKISERVFFWSIMFFLVSFFLQPLSSYAVDTEPPVASLEFSKPFPIGEGDVTIIVTTSEKVVSVPTPLIFMDTKGESFEIILEGVVPSASFEGLFIIDSNVAEGRGIFFFPEDALEDEAGNKGNVIISGRTFVIDRTGPSISGISAIPNPAIAGRIDISFVSSEILSGKSIVIVEGSTRELDTEKDNGDGSYTYSLTYMVPQGEGEGEGKIEIEAVDMAGNKTTASESFSMDVFAPYAMIDISFTSPLGDGSFPLELTVSKRVVSIPTPLRFTDSSGEVHEIELSGDPPGTIFTGVFVVDPSISEGLGGFSLARKALVDESGNEGNAIARGQTVVIDRTPPSIFDIKAIPNPGMEGRIDISFISSEILSGKSFVTVNDSSLPLGTAKDNGDGTYTYSLTYIVPSGEGEGEGILRITAFDLAGNMTEEEEVFSMEVFAPTAYIELSEPSPVGEGEYEVELTATKRLIAVPTPLRFTDSTGVVHNITLSGDAPGTTFAGTFHVDSSIAEGLGRFSLAPGALVDEYGNTGNTITSGQIVVIDMTPPVIRDIEAFPDPTQAGRIDITFVSDEILSGDSVALINTVENRLASPQRNEDGSFTYSLIYTVPEGEAEGEGSIEIQAVDMAGNKAVFRETFSLDVFPPFATIELEKPSPLGEGSVSITLTTSKKVVSISRYLIFTDSLGEVHRIRLSGRTPGTIFTGVFLIDHNVSEGMGVFSLEPGALEDEYGNEGNMIIPKAALEIDKTPPAISNIQVVPRRETEGLLDISFISSEILSASTTFTINGERRYLSTTGKDNGDGTYIYTFSHFIPEEIAEGEGELEIEGVDFANNTDTRSTKFNMDVFSPKATVELSDPHPTGIGEIGVKVTTDERLVSLPSPLRFTDSQEKTHEIQLTGEIPGTSFLGIFLVDESVSEGIGYFSFSANTLMDKIGNRGNKIVNGDAVEIDKTSPFISSLSVKSIPSSEGRIDISFISSEILNGNSSFTVNGEKQKITSSGRDNGDGTYTYTFSYFIPEEIAEGEGELEIEGVDFANNTDTRSTKFNMDVFSPKATIELSDPSPIGTGEVEITVFLSEEVFSFPSPLRFTDSKAKVHEIELKGEVPSAIFSGVFVVSEDVSEGMGYFSFAPEALVDEFSNRGNRIIAGEKVEITKTKPEITDVTAIPNPTSEGIIDISFVSSEFLSANTNVIVNGTSKKLMTEGMKNEDGTFTYSLTYSLSREEGEGETSVEIIAVDLAGNIGVGATKLNLDVFSPLAQIELSKDLPLGLGEVGVKLTTSEVVVSSPTPLRYSDSEGKIHKIELSGSTPGTIFEGTFVVDDTVSEGNGIFSLAPDTLIDELTNKGNTIVSGKSARIDKTSPGITEVKATPNIVRAGPVMISFVSSETLGGNTLITIGDTKEPLLSEGRDNGDGTRTYTYSYLVEPNQDSQNIEVIIDAVDLGGNRARAITTFDIDTEAPTASITLSDPSPTHTGEVEVTVTTSEPVLSVPTPLTFTDSVSHSLEIKLEGDVPGAIFTGTLTIDEDIEEGLGLFSLRVGALVDLAGNRSKEIISGFRTVIKQVKGIGGWAFPNPFTPNGSGDETDRTEFKVANVEPGTEVIIKIYDINGRRITTLRDTKVWDGTNENGDIVEGGFYIYQIQAGREFASGTVVVIR